MIIDKAIEKYCVSLKANLGSELAWKDLDKDCLLKDHSLLSKYKLTAISIFYNEELNVIAAYLESIRLSRIFNIEKFIFVQNGSQDNTSSLLQALASLDSRVEIVNIEKNQGYGYGFKSGLQACKTDLVLINHSDCQFDAYAFFTQNFLKMLVFNPEIDLMLPVRVGRSFYAFFRSSLLKLLVFFILGMRVKEFNGQPKIFLKNNLGDINTLPNDFAFDMAIVRRLLLKAQNIIYLNSLELPRFDGKSSWSINFKGQLRLVRQYIASTFKLKKMEG